METRKKLTADEARRKFISGEIKAEDLAGDPKLLAGFLILMKEYIDGLKHQIHCLNRTTYGRKSERFVDPNQALLFQSQLEELLGKVTEMDEKARAQAKKKRPPPPPPKGHGRKKLPEDLPRMEERIGIPKEERICPECNGEMKKIGEEVTEKLCKIQLIFVRKIVREKYACQKCHEGVLTAEGPEEIVDRGMFDRSFLASIIVSKFKDHLPLYRQAEMYKRDGITLSVSTLCDQVALEADLLEPIYQRIRKEMLERPWIQADETPVLYVFGKGRGKKTKRSYIWAFRSGKDLIFYTWSPTRSSEVPLRILKGYKGKLQTDGYGGYDPVFWSGQVVQVNCMAHARRGFERALQSHKEYASLVLGLIRILYDVEKKLPEGKTEEEILARERIRREKSVPVLDLLKEWLDSHKGVVLPKSPLGKAIKYMLDRWEALTEYTRDGRLEIDNNGVERKIRPYAVGRKNWLQFGSEEGGRRSAVLMTLIECCRSLGIDPQLYFWDVLDRVGKCPASRIQDLTPWGWKEKYMAQAQEEFDSWRRKAMETVKA